MSVEGNERARPPRRRRASLGALAVGLCATLLAPPTDAREIDFQARVEAQRAIDRVYYSHQVGTTRSFEQAVPEEVIRGKVRTYLKKSAALEEFWHTQVTGEALQRELDRIALS